MKGKCVLFCGPHPSNLVQNAVCRVPCYGQKSLLADTAYTATSGIAVKLEERKERKIMIIEFCGEEAPQIPPNSGNG